MKILESAVENQFKDRIDNADPGFLVMDPIWARLMKVSTYLADVIALVGIMANICSMVKNAYFHFSSCVN